MLSISCLVWYADEVAALAPFLLWGNNIILLVQHCQEEGKAISALPSNLHGVIRHRLRYCLLPLSGESLIITTKLPQPLVRSLVLAHSYLTPHPTALPFPQHHPWVGIHASLWKQAPFVPAGCTSLLQAAPLSGLFYLLLTPNMQTQLCLLRKK